MPSANFRAEANRPYGPSGGVHIAGRARDATFEKVLPLEITLRIFPAALKILPTLKMSACYFAAQVATISIPFVCWECSIVAMGIHKRKCRCKMRVEVNIIRSGLEMLKGGWDGH